VIDLYISSTRVCIRVSFRMWRKVSLSPVRILLNPYVVMFGRTFRAHTIFHQVCVQGGLENVGRTGSKRKLCSMYHICHRVVRGVVQEQVRLSYALSPRLARGRTARRGGPLSTLSSLLPAW